MGSLFDFSFSRFVTTSLIRFLYALFVIVAGLAAIALFIAGIVMVADGSGGTGLLIMIASPIAFLLLTILVRVQLEVVIVIFRIAEYLGEMAGREPRPPQ